MIKTLLINTIDIEGMTMQFYVMASISNGASISQLVLDECMPLLRRIKDAVSAACHAMP